MKKLEKVVHDSNNGLDYILVGNYYIPMLIIEEKTGEIGFYGSLRRNYLKDYKKLLYSQQRIFHPGSEADEMLCLIGTQGAGKSIFFRFLAIRDEWFSD